MYHTRELCHCLKIQFGCGYAMHHQQQYRTTSHCSSETRVKLYGILQLGGTGQHEKLNPFAPEVVGWHLTMLPQW